MNFLYVRGQFQVSAYILALRGWVGGYGQTDQTHYCQIFVIRDVNTRVLSQVGR